MNIFTKFFTCCILSLCVGLGVARGQTISVGNVDPGAGNSYGQGSTIAVPITITQSAGGYINQGNVFTAELLDAGGNVIATTAYSGVYTGFLNLNVPASVTTGSGYKVRVRSSNPASTVTSGSFSIAASPVPVVKLKGESTVGTTTDVFGRCTNSTSPFNFTNQSSNADAVTATIVDLKTGSVVSTLDFSSGNTQSFTPGDSYYSVTVKAVKNGVVSTKTYYYLNNTERNPFINVYQDPICENGIITFEVDPVAMSGNFDGNIYTIDWGDGSPIQYLTKYEILALNKKITHVYNKAICQNGGAPFQVIQQSRHPFCDLTSAQQRPTVVVYKKPVLAIGTPAKQCADKTLTFVNNSIPGSTASACEDPNSTYTWYVDGVEVLTDVPKSTSLTHTFTTNGNHTVAIKYTSYTPCPVSNVSVPVCIQAQPTVSFNIIEASPSCAPATIHPQNTSVVDASCSATNTWNWSVSGTAGGWTIDDAGAQSPEIKFTKAGKYTISLSVTTSACGIYTAPDKFFVVNEVPVATLSADKVYCGANRTFKFDNTNGDTQTTLRGTGEETGTTYTWDISPAAGWAFKGGSNIHTKYPEIEFTATGSYTIKVTHTNSCGTADDTQVLEFKPSPESQPGTYAAICPEGNVTLDGKIVYNGTTYNSVSTLPAGITFEWLGGAAGTISDRTILNPVYTPAASEYGTTVRLTLRVKSLLNPSPCDVIDNWADIIVRPKNIGADKTLAAICDKTSFGNYDIRTGQPSTLVAGSSFSWTATGTNVTGFSANGTGNFINDILTLTDAANPGSVTYSVTPRSNNCDGTAFDITVPVKPRPVLTLPAALIVCSGNAAGITLNSSLPGTTYTWSSSGSGVTGKTNQATPILVTEINDVLVNSGTVDKTVTYTVTPYANGCDGTAKPIVVTVKPPATAANAGADKTICRSSYVLEGNDVAPFTGTWSIVGHPEVTFSPNANVRNATAGGLLPDQTYTFQWSVTGSGCSNNNDDVVITTLPALSTPLPGADASLCNWVAPTNNTFTLNANNGSALPSFETGKWTIQSEPDGSAAYILPADENKYNAVIRNLSPTTPTKPYVFKWEVKNDCGSASNTMQLFVYPVPIAGRLTGGDNICEGATALQLEYVPHYTSTFASWQSSSSASAGFTDIPGSGNTYTPTALTQTTYYRVRVSSLDPTCPGQDFSNVKVINVTPKSVGGVSSGAATVCKDSNHGYVTLDLTTVTGDVQKWQYNTGTVWIDIANATNQYEYTDLSVTTKYRAVVKNGAYCPEAYSTETTITVVPPVSTPRPGSDTKICDQPTYPMTAEAPTVGQGTWTLISGQTGITYASHDPHAVVSGLVPDDNPYKFEWRIKGTLATPYPCGEKWDFVSITVRPKPADADASATDLCHWNALSNNTVTLTGTSPAHAYEHGEWRIINFPTGSGATITNAQMASATLKNTIPGKYILGYKLVNDVPCEGAEKEVTINIYKDPEPGVLKNAQTVCEGTPVTLTLDGSDGAHFKWQTSTSATGSWTDITSNDDQLTYALTDNSAGIRFFRVKVFGENAACDFVPSNVVKIEFTLPTKAGDATGERTWCLGSASGNVTLANSRGVITWQSSADSLTWSNTGYSSTTQPYLNLQTTTWYRAVVKNGDCPESTSNTVKITVNPTVPDAHAGDDKIVCNVTEYQLNGNAETGFTGLWTVSGHPEVTFSPDASHADAIAKNLTPGNAYTFAWTLNGQAPCPSKPDDVRITIRPKMVAQITAIADVCDNTETANNNRLIRANQPRSVYNETGKWKIESQPTGGNAAIADDTQYNTSISNLIPGEYILSWQLYNDAVDAPCVTTAARDTFQVYPQPLAGAVTPSPAIVCKGDPSTLRLAGYSKGVIEQWETSDNASFTNPIIIAETSDTHTFTNIQNTLFYRVKIKSLGPNCQPVYTTGISVVVNEPSKGGETTSNYIVCSGDAAERRINLDRYIGTPIYWEYRDKGDSNWTRVFRTNVFINYSGLTKTREYRAWVQNGVCNPDSSTITTITVNDPPIQAKAGEDETLCAQTTYQLHGNSANAGSKGKWTLSPSRSEITFDNDTIPDAKASGLIAGKIYNFVWRISNEQCGYTEDAVTITNLAPLENKISAVPTVCSGSDVTINGEKPTGGDNINYEFKWESSTDSLSWTVIPGETNQSLIVTGLTQTTSFRRTVTSGQCLSVSTVKTVTVQPALSNNVVGTDQSVCYAKVPLPLTEIQAPTGGDGNYTYQWQKDIGDGTGFKNIFGANTASYQPDALTKTTKFKRVIKSGQCTVPLESNIITITVNPLPKANYTYTEEKGCVPFAIDASNIRVVDFADGNGDYHWYADGRYIGKGITFPGYTINTFTTTGVVIKLVAISKFGCDSVSYEHTFGTRSNVTPKFTMSVKKGCGPLTVQFDNKSSSFDDVTFHWDFGNGQTSDKTYPDAVTFDARTDGRDSLYFVTLTSATPSCGSKSVTDTVWVRPKPIAIFTPDNLSGCSPFKVNFTNLSPGTGNKYTFKFGDGTPAETYDDTRTVSHIYTTNILKNFKVTMVAQNECGIDSASYSIRVFPNDVVASVVVVGERKGCAPFYTEFKNNSVRAKTYVYDFGDGSVEQSSTAPEIFKHIYKQPGKYRVKVTASNGCAENYAIDSVEVYPNPEFKITAAPTEGCGKIAVVFNNQTKNAKSYRWEFGDGTYSTEVNPVHIYDHVGSPFTVKIIATSAYGCTDTLVLPDYINVYPKPKAAFDVDPGTEITVPKYSFVFQDKSPERPNKWRWDFGDGTFSTLQSPTHAYTDTGYFNVRLIVMNKNGCADTIAKMVKINSVEGKLFVPNAFIPGSRSPELSVFRVKATGMSEWRMRVFNKWGQQLWESTALDDTGTPTEGWDGMMNGIPAPQGVYVWEIKAKFKNGSEWKGMAYDGKEPKRVGVIHLIR
ncbi:PKD domain-containing protein [Pedobacter sp. HMF7647]|uniref:PKD domain-containing protein n=1 Tax=Hufsiella arboris TaxID=2695275 RepID=A0A7K1Y8U8_9SPHI|nr:PKD domain-containing protein [Hufsiella arboris]MXV51016.1 PKD domain-containing protein [Hufsiella arboris]